MAGSESRTSTRKYKDGNIIEMHNVLMWRLSNDAEQCSTVLTRKEASESIGYL
jgi:hypothetical protein